MYSTEGGAPFRSRWTNLWSGTNTGGEEEKEAGEEKGELLVVVEEEEPRPASSTC